MNRNETIEIIRRYASHPNAFDQLEAYLSDMSDDALRASLLTCGIIPEMYSPDSSEEKLWAKYCDILLSKAWNALGISSNVLRTRGNSADVFGVARNYTLVGDAKAFRLSRTAKNQKDFKVTSLDDWRRDNTFACLVSPLAQYPSDTSQIYYQAEDRNVTLLSYIHIKFLLDHSVQASLQELWEVAGSLQPSRQARRYWDTLDQCVVALTGTSSSELQEYKQLDATTIQIIGEEGIAYWKTVIQNYRGLSQEEAVQRLIHAEKIETKMRTIRVAMSRGVVL